MVLGDEDARGLGLLDAALTPDRLAVPDADLDRPAAVDVGAGIERVAQHILEEAHCRQLPAQLEAATHGLVHRQLDALVVEPAMRLADAAQHIEAAKHHRHGLLHAQVGVFDDALVGVHHVARCQHTTELTPAGLGLAALLHTQLQRTELQHAQGALDAQQQLIVQPIQVVDVVGVADERVEHPAQLHQVAPVLVGA